MRRQRGSARCAWTWRPSVDASPPAHAAGSCDRQAPHPRRRIGREHDQRRVPMAFLRRHRLREQRAIGFGYGDHGPPERGPRLVPVVGCVRSDAPGRVGTAQARLQCRRRIELVLLGSLFAGAIERQAGGTAFIVGLDPGGRKFGDVLWRRIDQHKSGDIRRPTFGVAPDDGAAERVADQDDRRIDLRGLDQRAQVAHVGVKVARQRPRVAETEAGTIVAQTRVDRASSGCTFDHAIESAIAPLSRMMAGAPLPLQRKFR